MANYFSYYGVVDNEVRIGEDVLVFDDSEPFIYDEEYCTPYETIFDAFEVKAFFNANKFPKQRICFVSIEISEDQKELRLRRCNCEEIKEVVFSARIEGALGRCVIENHLKGFKSTSLDSLLKRLNEKL